MTQHKNIYIALAAAQSEMGPVVKGATNPHFKNKYADLADVMAVALPALTANGICLWQSIICGESRDLMRTTFTHGESETSIHCDVPLIVQKNDMQGMKSATTYAKRIGLESLAGIAPEDDDGNAAAKAAPTQEQRKPAQQQAQKPSLIESMTGYILGATSMDDLERRWNDPKFANDMANGLLAADQDKIRATYNDQVKKLGGQQ